MIIQNVHDVLIRLVGLKMFTMLWNMPTNGKGAFRSTNNGTNWTAVYDATTTITDQMAVTHVDQTFTNTTGMRMEGILVFPLPPNAVVTEVALWQDGVRMVGKTMESDTARAVYDATVRRSIDPALLEYMVNR